jgi:hypothetical protein
MKPIPRTYTSPLGAFRQTSRDMILRQSHPWRSVIDADDRHIARFEGSDIGSVCDGDGCPAEIGGIGRKGGIEIVVHDMERADSLVVSVRALQVAHRLIRQRWNVDGAWQLQRQRRT